MAVAVAQPGAGAFVRLKLRLLRNGLRGQTVRVVGFVLSVVLGGWFALAAGLGLLASAAGPVGVGYVVATFAGTAILLGWVFMPLLFFGVDETVDPARFALLPVRRGALARGMLAAAFVGVPPVATAVAMMGLFAAAWIRFGPVAAAAALVGIAAALVTCVAASRAVTSAFANLLRSRRVRDLAAVVIAVLASSMLPIQWGLIAVLNHGTLDQAVRVARALAWTPLAAPFALPYDVAAGAWGRALLRLGLSLGAIALLLWWWSRTIESAMLGVSSGGSPRAANARREATAGLFAAVTRLLPRGLFGAIVAREWRYWRRDPRRRAAMISVLIASVVLPIALSVSGPAEGPREFVTGMLLASALIAGALGGVLLANQFGYDGSAYAAHLLAAVPGRVELLARAVAIGLIAVPVQVVVIGALTALRGDPGQLPTTYGVLAASFGVGLAVATTISVMAPYELPENQNPFALSGGSGSLKGLLALVGMGATAALSAPALAAAIVLRSWTLGPVMVGPWLTLLAGLGYGAAAVWLGCLLVGGWLDRRGPELLIAVTPRR